MKMRQPFMIIRDIMKMRMKIIREQVDAEIRDKR